MSGDLRIRCRTTSVSCAVVDMPREQTDDVCGALRNRKPSRARARLRGFKKLKIIEQVRDYIVDGEKWAKKSKDSVGLPSATHTHHCIFVL